MNIRIVNKHYHSSTARDFFIGRPSPLGNPFNISISCPRDEVIRLYGIYLKQKVARKDSNITNALLKIISMAQEPDGVNLVCFCVPKRCHGEMIIEVIREFYASPTT